MPFSAARVLEAQARTYRRTWRGSAISAFLNPVLYLAAMGLGLGTLVDRGAGSAHLGQVSYLVFLAPGLLAAAAMQTGAGEAAWPVMAGIRWTKTYQATLATPVSVRDLVLGHLGWVGVRLLMTTWLFALIGSAFGAFDILRGLLSTLPAILTGLAFAAVITAYAAWLENDQGLTNLFRFGIIPLFLFSGTFFPISQLPGWMQPLAYATPLWHGVQLTRGIALGIPTRFAVGWHLAYLLLLVGVGYALSVWRLRKRLKP